MELSRDAGLIFLMGLLQTGPGLPTPGETLEYSVWMVSLS